MDSKTNLIMDYLQRKLDFHKELITILQHGKNQDAVHDHRVVVDALDDIIHDLNVLVKRDLKPEEE